jgi:hypothetical protein
MFGTSVIVTAFAQDDVKYLCDDDDDGGDDADDDGDFIHSGASDYNEQF